MTASEASGPTVVLGAGYAGLTVAQQVARGSKGARSVVLVDRHPVHVLRTQLYEIERIAAAQGDTRRWTVPLARVLERSKVEFREGSVDGIDLGARRVHLASGEVEFGALAICLGSTAAYYGVPGAAEHCHHVYRLSAAQRLAAALVEVELASVRLAGERRPRVVVIGGGSTGTELAAEIAGTDWARITGVAARAPDVFLLTGALPFLGGFPEAVIARARHTLRRAGVGLVHGLNVVRVEPGRVVLEDGSAFQGDIVVWCAGLEAPPAVKTLAVPHGKGGRILVDPTLEVPDHPGVFAVGDAAEHRDPETGVVAPSTAQAALEEARVAARNLNARRAGEPLVPFRYREKGVVVALGPGRAAGRVSRVTVWGSPAALLKRLVERDYARSVARGDAPSLI